MAFQPIKSLAKGDAFKFEKVGDTLTGIYLGSFDHEGDYGPTKKHMFKTETGIKVVFGPTQLNDDLPTVPVGKLLQVTFTSLKPSKTKGRHPMKEFSIGEDPDYVATAEEVGNYVDDATSTYDDEPEASDDEIPADEVKTEPVKTRPAAQAPSNDRIAAVRAKLAAAGRKSA